MYNLQLQIKSYHNINSSIIISKIKKLLNFFNNNIKLLNYFPLPSTTKKFTLLKSPHVNKKAREHFQFKINKTLIILTSTNIFIIFNFLIFFQKLFEKKYYISFKIIKTN